MNFQNGIIQCYVLINKRIKKRARFVRDFCFLLMVFSVLSGRDLRDLTEDVREIVGVIKTDKEGDL